eukprot:CFRG6185T1
MVREQDKDTAARKFQAPPVAVAETNETRKLSREEISNAKAFDDLKTRIHSDCTLGDEEKKFCTDACILRYLRAREYHLGHSEALLRGTLKWRKEYWKNDSLNPHGPLKLEAETGKVLVHGLDKNKQPVLYLRPGLQNTENYAEQNRLTVYMLERCIESMDARYGVEKLTLIIDFRHYSIRNAPPLAQARETVTILSEHYPERLGMALMVDAPMVFNMTYNLLKPFIPVETKKKIHFISGSTKPGHKKYDTFARYMDMSDVPKDYGGMHEFEYDHDHYWGREMKLYSQKMNKEQLNPV